MTQHLVAIVDDSQDMCALLSTFVSTQFNTNSLCFTKFGDVKAKEQDVLQCKLIILDINLGTGLTNGIDVYHWLVQKNFKGKIYFLTGHAQSHPLVQAACTLGAEVFEKPLNLKQIRSIVEAAIN